ncbi:Protein of unknown function [Escherichia coli D6-113.11]|nr:Protein of unknown function [Escherichia coli D6-113.11]CDU32652.1 Protein of unknown function [Escherichia coli D6-113.11]
MLIRNLVLHSDNDGGNVGV